MTGNRLFLLLTLALLLVACEQAAPTPLPTNTIAAPTTGEALPATSTTAAPTATATAPAPTPTTAPTDTAVPEATPTVATATPTAEPVPLQVEAPAEGETLAVGSSVTVAGTAAPGAQQVTVALTAAGLTLVESAVTLGEEETSWQTLLDVPEDMVGNATLQATLADGTSVTVPVSLARPAATSDTTLTLTYPMANTKAVAGHVLFFTGRAQRPYDDAITIAVLFEACQTVAAAQTFTVGEGGQWWGFVNIPETVFGPACAVAYTGPFAGEDWRAAHTPLTILPIDDPAARGVFIGNFPDAAVAPGEVLTVYGSAFNVPEDQVLVSLEVDGAVVVEGTASVDRFGYWETALTLPAGTTAPANGEIIAIAPYGDDPVTDTVPFEVVAE